MHVQCVIRLFAKRQNNSLNAHKSQKDDKLTKALILPGFVRLDSARIFTKMSLDEQLGTLGFNQT